MSIDVGTTTAQRLYGVKLGFLGTGGVTFSKVRQRLYTDPSVNRVVVSVYYNLPSGRGTP